MRLKRRIVNTLEWLFLCRSVENYLYRMIAMTAFAAAVLMAIGLPGLEDRWCMVSMPAYIAITFFIASFDDPWGAKEDRTDLIALFWPVITPVVIVMVIYFILSDCWGLKNNKSSKRPEEENVE